MSNQAAAAPSTIGRFRIDALLGTGGMGAVYKAFDPKLKRDVAVKTIRPDMERPESVRRFYREAQALAKLSHKNIIVVHDVGEYDGGVYIAMEYLRGQNLADASKDGSLGLRTKLEVLIAVLDGLQHAHEAGVIHRDVKPNNVHLLPDGSVKLLDFGLARIEEADASLTKTGDLLCTPHYASPEQLRGEEVDARSDVFSAGATAYRLLVGRLPFDAPSLSGVMVKVLSEEPPDVDAEWRADVPALDGFLRRAMAKDPRERYQSASEMRSALQQILTDSAGAIAAFDERHPPAPVPAPSDAPADVSFQAEDGGTADWMPQGDTSGAPQASTYTFVGPIQPDAAAYDTAAAHDAGAGQRHQAPQARLWLAAAIALVAVAAGAVWYFVPATPSTGREATATGRSQGVPPFTARDPSGTPTDASAGISPAVRTPDTAAIQAAAPAGATSGPALPGSTKAVAATGAPPAVAGSSSTARAPSPRADAGATGIAGPSVDKAARQLFDAAAGATARNTGLKYRVVQRLVSGDETDVDPARTFSSGDRVKFVFESNVDGYLYVAVKGSTGRWAVLFPGPAINGGLNRIDRGSQYLVPDNGWFRLDDTPGTEQIFVVLSKEPLSQLPGFRERVVAQETLSARVVDDVRNGIQSRDLIFEKDAAASGGTGQQVTYVVNRDELGTAVAATISLAHGQ